MIFLLILLFGVASCNSNEADCSFNEEQTIIALNALRSRNILSLTENELCILTSEKTKYLKLPKRNVNLHDSKVKLIDFDSDKPWIKLMEVEHSQSNIQVKFKASEDGYKYNGNVIFECSDNVLLFKDIQYISQIN